MQQGGKLDISAQFDGVMIHGIAAVDAVIGTRGKVKMRARFGHGIKAVFELGEYGECWQAEAVTEEQPAATVTASTTDSSRGTSAAASPVSTATASASGHGDSLHHGQRPRLRPPRSTAAPRPSRFPVRVEHKRYCKRAFFACGGCERMVSLDFKNFFMSSFTL